MKLLLVQSAPVWCDTAASVRSIAHLLSGKADGADIIVLPEMWNTGFVTKPADELMDEAHAAVAKMHDWARCYDAAVAGSVATKDEAGNWRNAFKLVLPSGEETCYYKRHLFTFGGENGAYVAGEQRVEATWRGVKLLLQTCYDLRFPKFSRNAAAAPYDLVLYVASWPAVRRTAWDVLLRARAIENQAFVAGVNRVGDDLACTYNGGSAVIDAKGKYLVGPIDDEACAVRVDLNMDELKAFRKKFPVLNEAD